VTVWKNVSGSAISVPIIGRDVANLETVSVHDDIIMPTDYFNVVAVPRNVTVTADTGVVSWDPPASGPEVVDYLVTEWPGGFIAVTAEASVNVADLFSWLFSGTTAHTFTVRARSAMGISMASDPSDPVTPPSVPDPPTSVSATASGDLQAEVSWTAPANDGGAPVDTYVVVSDGESQFSATGAASPVSVTGLTLGDSYTFTVQAGNRAGLSLPSSASNSVTAV